MVPWESRAILGLLDTPFAMLTGVEKVAPPSIERLKKPLLSPLKALQVMLIFPAESTAICGAVDPPGSLEGFWGLARVSPPFWECVKNTASYPALLSHQTTLMLPAGSTATWPSRAPPVFEIFRPGEK